MMLHPSTQQLIRKLHELTEAGAVTWKEGAGQRLVFETEGYVVEIQPDPPGIRLLRADGQELETADAADLATAWPDGGGTYASHVADMARGAGRIARGAETAIAKILSSLSAPPKKQPEPEPEPAALAFAAAPAKPIPSVSAGESAAAIAAVNADLESQRRKAAEDPPASHSVPHAPIAAVAPETETAIDRVLAVQPAPQPEPPKPAPAPEPVPVAKAEPPAPPPAPKASPSTPVGLPRAIDLPPPFADATMQPRLKPETVAPVVAPPPRSEPVAAATPTPQPVVAKPQPVSAPPAPGFGAIGGFARTAPTPAPQPKPEPKPEPSKITSGGLLVSGFSARSRQIVESSTAQDAFRPAPPAAPQPAPPPPPEKKLEPAAATGADVYKPWA